MATKSKSTDIAMTRERALPAIVPQNVNELISFAQMAHESKLAPAALDTAEKIFVAVGHGMEIGLSPFQALQSTAVINGRATVWGDALLALVRKSGLLTDIRETCEKEPFVAADGKEYQQYVATCTLVREGAECEPVRFSQEDATVARLWNKSGPWQTYPKRMLQMRARAFALRDNFGDVLLGMAVAEEVEDFDGQTTSSDRDAKVSLAERIPTDTEENSITGHVEAETADEVVVEAEQMEEAEQAEQASGEPASVDETAAEQDEEDELPPGLDDPKPEETDSEPLLPKFHAIATKADSEKALSETFAAFREENDIEEIPGAEREALRDIYRAHLGRIKGRLDEADFNKAIEAALGDGT